MSQKKKKAKKNHDRELCRNLPEDENQLSIEKNIAEYKS